MSEKQKPETPKNDTEDSKAKFREALEKKKQGNGIRNDNTTGGLKVFGGQATSGNAPKMFRRKSGSA